MDCIDDPLKIHGAQIDRQVTDLRAGLVKQGCKSLGKASCEGQKGCVKIWLQAITCIRDDYITAVLLELGWEKPTQEQRRKVGEIADKEFFGKNAKCLIATHSAWYDCCDGKVKSIPGPLGATQETDSFKNVVDKQGKPFGQDAEEFWLCPCRHKKEGESSSGGGK